MTKPNYNMKVIGKIKRHIMIEVLVQIKNSWKKKFSKIFGISNAIDGIEDDFAFEKWDHEENIFKSYSTN